MEFLKRNLNTNKYYASKGHLNNNAFTYTSACKSVNSKRILDVFTEEISFECMFLGSSVVFIF